MKSSFLSVIRQLQRERIAAMAIADPAKRVVALSFITLNLLEKPFSFALVT